MPFYTFRQNNSGGSFDYDEQDGISANVIIEANSESEAISRASGIGLYFDGSGDCSCCGSRWSEYADENPTPAVYGQTVNPGDVMPRGDDAMKWIDDGYEGFIHYTDGRIEGFWKSLTPLAEEETDGTYGYGVTFNRNHVTLFAASHNGYDISGNQQAYDIYDQGFHRRPFPPANRKAVVKVNDDYGYGNGWFPTKADAVEFATTTAAYINEVNARITQVAVPRGYAKLKKLFGFEHVDVTNLIDDYHYDEEQHEWVEGPAITVTITE